MSSRVIRAIGRSGSARVPALLAIAALVASGLAAASESGETTPSSPIIPAAFGSAPVIDTASLTADVEPVAVTLITGDAVLWRDTGDGNAGVAEIEEAPREVPVYFDKWGSAEDFYVIPSDVMPRVVDGSLDMELFNIPGLIRQGLDDRTTGGQLPVIVTFDESADAKQLERDANALPASSQPQAVEGIQGAGVKIDRDKAAEFRDAVLGNSGTKRGPRAQSDNLMGEVDKVLLDQMLEIDLSESVPQVGAPAAWEAGYTGEGVTVAVLDTGVDDTHPDLAGQVVIAENFVGDGEPIDDHGHGTHVASTVAGTGAASDGARKGVASDADLLSGKVCNSEGGCPTSAVMAGMEWAAERADVVNMSLSSPSDSDGTDVLSQLVNRLSAETGTLFVTAAGNRGCRNRVGSPAAADAALAVGAVDKNDNLASFSSCGPRLGDYAVKPEITAPGVGIIAARAEGSDLAPPVDDVYMSLNGTSMASPHVAGAAALLAQAQDLAGQELKDALVSTATDVGRLWYQQGTGRVDVPAALGSLVYAQGTLNLGQVTDRAEQDITYTNRSDHDITLALDAAVTDDRGQALDVLSLSATSLTVPAGGQATVTVAVDVTGVPDRRNLVGGGIVTATGDGLSLRTGIGFGPARHRVAVEVLDSNGDRVGTARAADFLVLFDHKTYDPASPVGEALYRLATNDGIGNAYLPTGTYTLYTSVTEVDPDTGKVLRRSGLIKVEVPIDGDTTITLDARDAVPVKATVPREVDRRALVVTLSPNSSWSFVLSDADANPPIYVTPAPPADLGSVGLFVHWTLAEPQPLQPLRPDCSDAVEERWCYSEAPSYVYNLPFLYENGIPRNLHEKVTRKDLVEIPTRYHSDHPGDAVIKRRFEAFPPPSLFTCGFGGCGGLYTEMWIRPGEVTEYVLADDRFTWIHAAALYRPPEGKLPTLEQPRPEFGQNSYDWFPAAEAGNRRAEERWFEAPLRVGAADIREDFFHARYEINPDATAARGGTNGNQFFPGFQMMDNSRGHFRGPSSLIPSFASWRMWNLNTGTELDGVEFSPVHRPGVPMFTLSSEPATYRLEQAGAYPEAEADKFLTGPATTTWTFTSAPSDAQVPNGYECVTVPGDVCQIQPLIQLEYKLGLDLQNRAPAGRAHAFTINAGHHSKAINRAKVTDLSVEASFDDGDTWVDARVVGKAKDTSDTGGFLPSAEPYQQYKAVLEIPPLHRTNGYVTLRVEAEDANGGTVDQTVHRAYLLK